MCEQRRRQTRKRRRRRKRTRTRSRMKSLVRRISLAMMVRRTGQIISLIKRTGRIKSLIRRTSLAMERNLMMERSQGKSRGRNPMEKSPTRSQAKSPTMASFKVEKNLKANPTTTSHRTISRTIRTSSTLLTKRMPRWKKPLPRIPASPTTMRASHRTTSPTIKASLILLFNTRALPPKKHRTSRKKNWKRYYCLPMASSVSIMSMDHHPPRRKTSPSLNRRSHRSPNPLL
mmetsp:Transcript_26358/g.56596  ORF Transcript_26358/g.56596 Transcript_26358/m.56596 type:complete len:231 (-) Transcript_26358:323-1015(-)